MKGLEAPAATAGTVSELRDPPGLPFSGISFDEDFVPFEAWKLSMRQEGDFTVRLAFHQDVLQSVDRISIPWGPRAPCVCPRTASKRARGM